MKKKPLKGKKHYWIAVMKNTQMPILLLGYSDLKIAMQWEIAGSIFSDVAEPRKVIIREAQ